MKLQPSKKMNLNESLDLDGGWCRLYVVLEAFECTLSSALFPRCKQFSRACSKNRRDTKCLVCVVLIREATPILY